MCIIHMRFACSRVAVTGQPSFIYLLLKHCYIRDDVSGCICKPKLRGQRMERAQFKSIVIRIRGQG